MGKFSPITKHILAYLESNYKDEISLKQLRETFFTSPNYISKLFNKEMGRSIPDYLNELRINKSKDWLKNDRYKIYEVAQLVGFKSQVHFTIVFNKYVGMPPKDYRKSVT